MGFRGSKGDTRWEDRNGDEEYVCECVSCCFVGGGEEKGQRGFVRAWFGLVGDGTCSISSPPYTLLGAPQSSRVSFRGKSSVLDEREDSKLGTLASTSIRDTRCWDGELGVVAVCGLYQRWQWRHGWWWRNEDQTRGVVAAVVVVVVRSVFCSGELGSLYAGNCRAGLVLEGGIYFFL